jgi:hypothetical protein
LSKGSDFVGDNNDARKRRHVSGGVRVGVDIGDAFSDGDGSSAGQEKED